MRSIGVLLSSEAVAKAVLFLGSIALARLYTPAEIGLLSAYLAIVTLGAAVANLALQRAIPLPRSGHTARTLAATGLCATLILSGAAGVTVLVGLTLGLFGAHGLDWTLALVLVPFGVLSWASYPIAQMALTRIGAFGPLAALKMGQAFGVTGLQVLFGLLGGGGAALALADTLSRGLALGYVLGRRPGTLGRLRAAAGLRRMRAALRRYRRFPRLVVPTILLQTLPMTLLPLAILRGLGPEAAGHWHLMAQVMLAVIAVSVALTPYFLHKWAKAAQTDQGLQGRDLIRPLVILTGVATAPCLALWIWSEPLFVLVFGPDWALSGALIGILAPAMLIQFAGGPFIVILNIIGRERQNISVSALWGAATVALCTAIVWGGLDLTATARIQTWIIGTVYTVYILASFGNILSGANRAAA